MKRAMMVAATCLALLGPGTARADVLRFSGDARISLYERLDHEDHWQVEQTVVDLKIELQGPRAASSEAQAVGSATITGADGTFTIPLHAAMYPPEGNGGFVHASGIAEGAIYCFRIWDLADAPTPRSDRLTAAFESLDRFRDGFAARPSTAATTDICHALEYREGPPLSGDFSFSTLA